MSKKNKEKECIFCRKALLDEKVPLCLRCRIKKRDVTAAVMGAVGTVALAVGSAKVIKDDEGSST